MSFLVNHSYLGVDLWTILVLILLVGVCVFWVIRHRQMKKKQAELEDRISELYKEKADTESNIPNSMR